MSGNPSPAARLQLAELRQVAEKIQHVHGLVERFAGTRDPRQMEQLTPPLKRALGRLKLYLMGAGLDNMAQLAGALEIAAGRSGPPQSKGRILREGVGSLRSQLDQEQRRVLADDKALQARMEASKPAGSPEDPAS
jgi:hypothetical protein